MKLIWHIWIVKDYNLPLLDYGLATFIGGKIKIY